MEHLRVTSPTDRVVEIFAADPAVGQLAVMRGVSLGPAGDIVLADVAREATNDIVDRLTVLGIPDSDTIHLEPVTTWISRAGLDSERRAPGAGADADGRGPTSHVGARWRPTGVVRRPCRLRPPPDR